MRWQAEPGNRQEVETLLRDLHTLKGGARMVEIGPIGDLAHELENLYESLSAGTLQGSAELFALLQRGQRITGLATHYERLDELTSGLQPSDLIIIAGRVSNIVNPQGTFGGFNQSVSLLRTVLFIAQPLLVLVLMLIAWRVIGASLRSVAASLSVSVRT